MRLWHESPLQSALGQGVRPSNAGLCLGGSCALGHTAERSKDRIWNGVQAVGCSLSSRPLWDLLESPVLFVADFHSSDCEDEIPNHDLLSSVLVGGSQPMGCNPFRG